MIQLKTYQQRVLNEIREYFEDAKSLGGAKGIRYAFMDKLGDDVQKYKPIEGLEETPFVCIKVPTGGGKTLIASHALEIMHEAYNKEQNRAGLVLWLVPSDAIRQQTLSALRDKNHPYREAIDLHFDGNVKIYTAEEALSGLSKSDLTDNLCIIVSSLAAFRREDSSWLKAFKDNGSLISHFVDVVEENDFLEKSEDGEVINSLANVIRMNRPIVVLDEGHNAQTTLSFDMFRRMSPSIILELTATPRSESNVLVDVTASELKAEKMVKIPIYLTNVSQWQEAIRDGLSKRSELEKIAKTEQKATKEYIRPIMLIQAEQEKEDDDKVYVAKIKEFLVTDLKVDESEIRIKTAKQDQLVNEPLMSKTSGVRYIITVNALKEGWDCPFAYVLVSASKIGSHVAVEQTIGRILRMPNVKDKKNIELNYSYVYSSTENFSKASSAIVKALESNGYSKDDLRPLNGPVHAEKISFDRVFKDKIAIPVLSKKGSDTALAFNKDLVGRSFSLLEHYSDFDFNFINDQDASVKIDLNEKEGIVRLVQGKLVLVYNLDDFSADELGTWLKKNTQNRVISGDEMAEFINKTLAYQLKKFSIQELSINRYKLKESISDAVNRIISSFAKSTFEKLGESRLIVADEIFMDLPDSIVLGRTSPEYFSKHLYERAGHLNGEETDFAFKLNELENIDWWYRNREKEDFYLQGWLSSKFYPDFILKMKSGAYVLVEYKGEDRLSNDDTAWKIQLGDLWQKLNADKHRFYLVGKKEAPNIIRDIERIR